MVAEIADGYGGGIETYGEVTIMSSAFDNCSALYDGGAIYAHASTNTSVYSTTFHGNTAAGTGSAIYSDGYVYLTLNTFLNNTAEGNNGQVIAGNLTLEGCENTGLYGTKSCSGSSNSSGSVGGNSTPATSSSKMVSVFLAALCAPLSLLLS